MVKTKREIQNNLKLVDAVIEIRDARIPKSSKNPDIDTLCAGKPRVILLNKSDLTDPKVTKAWKESLTNDETIVLEVNALKGEGLNAIKPALLKLLKDAAKVLAPAGYDIELVEKHHNQKLDAPSGTALALADSVNEALGNEYHYVYDRSTVRQKRDAKEIGISALRGGTIVGEHEVIFAGTDEVIEFKHTAYSRSVFGKGAVEAAKFLAGKESGMYDMSDVVGL